jgi:hypothetical protein
VDETPKQFWQALAWAFASAGSGTVSFEGEELSAERFAAQIGLPSS